MSGRLMPPCTRCGQPLRLLAHDGRVHLRCPWRARLARLIGRKPR